MGLWSRLFGASAERREMSLSGPPLSDAGFGRWFTAGLGEPTAALSALGVASRCVDLIASTLAAIPVTVSRRLPGGGREEVPDHPLARLLNDAADDSMSSFECRELATRDLLLHGNAYVKITRDGRGVVSALTYLPYVCVAVERLPGAMGLGPPSGYRRLRYRFSDPSGFAAPETLLPEEIVHLRFAPRGGDCVLGTAPLAWARDAVRLAQEQAALAYDQARRGLTPDLSFEQSGNVQGFGSGDQAEAAFLRLKSQLTARVRGMRSDPTPLLLEGGLTARPLNASGREAQFHEARLLGLEDVCRVFGVPSTIVGLGKSASYGSLTEERRSLVSYCLSPWAARLDSQLNFALLSDDGRKSYIIEHDLSGLLRGDMEARLRAYATGVNSGVFSPNECRTWEGLLARPGGDEFVIPAGSQLQQQDQPNTDGARPNGSGAPPNARPRSAAS